MTGGPETGYVTGVPGAENLRRIFALEPDGILIDSIPFAKAIQAELKAEI